MLTTPVSGLSSIVAVTLLLLLICGLPAACAAEPPSLPDIPAGRALAGWLQACQSGKPAQMLEFVTGHYAPQALKEVPAEERAARMRMWYQTYRVLQLDRVEATEPNKVTGLFRSPITETWLRISANVTPEEPHYLTGISITDLPNADMAHKVTIHHLLTHTSGVGDYFNGRFDAASRARFREIKDYLPLFVDSPLEFEPGARFHYSNGGFMLLGAIVEKVSGQNYFDYVREHIYQPAGMSHTDAYALDHDTPNLATGYTRMSGDDFQGDTGPHNNIFMHVMRGGPAGGGYSTVEDLTRFSEALLSGKLLDKAHVDLLLAGKVDAGWGPGVRYAYGFSTREENGQRIVGHSGGFPGISSNLDIYLDSGYTVAVMSNYDPGTAELVSGWIHDRLGG